MGLHRFQYFRCRRSRRAIDASRAHGITLQARGAKYTPLITVAMICRQESRRYFLFYFLSESGRSCHQRPRGALTFFAHAPRYHARRNIANALLLTTFIKARRRDAQKSRQQSSTGMVFGNATHFQTMMPLAWLVVMAARRRYARHVVHILRRLPPMQDGSYSKSASPL